MNKYIKGTFIGTTSMGFVTGKQYYLTSKIVGYSICIYDINSNAYCPYSNLESLVKNWKLEYVEL